MKRFAAFSMTTALALLLVPFGAIASERGRTDGPEGSEIGKGGYERPGASNGSLAFEWGAAFGDDSDKGAPLYLGVKGGYSLNYWIDAEASFLYSIPTESYALLLGPSFRSDALDPIILFAGIKAGPMVFPGSKLYLGISPEVGAELLMGDRASVGLKYAVDFPISRDLIAHRIGMTLGYRF